MKLLIIDTETIGIERNPEINSVCEIAATLYQVESEQTTGAIASISTLLRVEENPAFRINGIPASLTRAAAMVQAKAVDLIQQMALFADYAIAFNAEFDAPLVEELIGKQRYLWLCAMRDIDWGYPNANIYGGFKLTDLALWLGVGISTVHRAGDDVRLLVECLNRRRSGMPEMIEKAAVRARSPLVELKALVSYENRELAKKAGFSWDEPRRIWVKKIRECDRAGLVESLTFETEILP